MSEHPAARRVLVAGIGNVLRGDDGFGVAVVEHLRAALANRASVTLIETGIGGINLVQQLMDGYGALIIVDAMDRGGHAGQVVVVEPELAKVAHETNSPIDLHQTDVEGVIRLAAAIGCLPPRVWVVGCQALGCDDLGAALSDPVRQAVPVAAARVRELISSVLASGSEEDSRALR